MQTSGWATQLQVPAEIGLKYPLNVADLVDSEDFMKKEPKNFQIDPKCPYKWEMFRQPGAELFNFTKNHAFMLYPGKVANELQGELYDHPDLARELKKQLEMKDEFVNFAQEKLHSVKKFYKNQKKEFVFVGIHSRRTDHLQYQQKQKKIPLTPSYYLGIKTIVTRGYVSYEFIFPIGDMSNLV